MAARVLLSTIALALLVALGIAERSHQFVEYCSETPSEWISIDDCQDGKRPHLFAIDVSTTDPDVQPEVYMALVSPAGAQCEFGTCRADEDGGYEVIVGEECVPDAQTLPRQAHFVDRGHAVSRQITISHTKATGTKRYYVQILPRAGGACSFKLSRGALFAEEHGRADCNEILAVDASDVNIGNIQSCAMTEMPAALSIVLLATFCSVSVLVTAVVGVKYKVIPLRRGKSYVNLDEVQRVVENEGDSFDICVDSNYSGRGIERSASNVSEPPSTRSAIPRKPSDGGSSQLNELWDSTNQTVIETIPAVKVCVSRSNSENMLFFDDDGSAPSPSPADVAWGVSVNARQQREHTFSGASRLFAGKNKSLGLSNVSSARVRAGSLESEGSGCLSEREGPASARDSLTERRQHRRHLSWNPAAPGGRN